MEHYEILTECHIDPKRLREFRGLSMEHRPDGTTCLQGFLRDQSELFAIIHTIRDMNLRLIHVLKNTEEQP